MPVDFRALWDGAMTYHQFIDASTEHKGLWEAVHRLARIPEWARSAGPVEGHRHLLAIVEDWCGDASNTIPVLARWAEEVPGIDMRMVRRDEHPELMDLYLTNGTRSIPIVIALDEEFRELGHWGPRPVDLQVWVMVNRPTTPKAELYPQIRRWYAKDHGESTIREVLAAMGVEAGTAKT
jgi:hypothetical protein